MPATRGGGRRYRVVHRTAYRYGEPVVSGQTVARVEPRTLAHQEVRRTMLAIEPEPSHWSHHDDGFGNHVTHLAFDEPHDHLVVTATSEVEVAPRPVPQQGWTAPWEQAVQALADDRSDDGLLARACRLDSPLVTRHPDLRAFAGAASARTSPTCCWAPCGRWVSVPATSAATSRPSRRPVRPAWWAPTCPTRGWGCACRARAGSTSTPPTA